MTTKIEVGNFFCGFPKELINSRHRIRLKKFEPDILQDQIRILNYNPYISRSYGIIMKSSRIRILEVWIRILPLKNKRLVDTEYLTVFLTLSL